MGYNLSPDKGDDKPVTNVTRESVDKFIELLNSSEKTTRYRLPTAAEWEHAARAGSVGDYFFFDFEGRDERLLRRYAWYWHGSRSKNLQPVGKLRPNPWGLYDVYGNAAEMTAEGAYRGGDFQSQSLDCSSRSSISSGSPSGNLGFRLAADIQSAGSVSAGAVSVSPAETGALSASSLPLKGSFIWERPKKFPQTGIVAGNNSIYKVLPLEQADWHSANLKCEVLDYLGSKDWHLPLREDFYNAPEYLLPPEASGVSALCGAPDPRDKGRAFYAKYYRTKFQGTGSSLAFGETSWFICKTDVPVAPTLLTAVLAAEELSRQCLPFVEEPPLKEEARLAKDEFETTADFNRRKAAREEELEALYREKLAAYQQRKDASAESCRQFRKNLEDPAHNTRFYAEAFNALNGYPLLAGMSYDADAQVFKVTVRRSKNKALPGGGAFPDDINFEIPVKAPYARDYKALIENIPFLPSLRVEVESDGSYAVFPESGEWKDPVQAVDSWLYLAARGNIEKLQAFVDRKPSFFKKEAEREISALREEAARQAAMAEEARKQWAIEQERRAQELAAYEERRRQSYLSAKQLGDAICLDVTMFFGFDKQVVKGYVDQVSGNRIQVRVSDGRNFYRDGEIIWASGWEWRHCAF
jgi:hypothetical protein